MAGLYREGTVNQVIGSARRSLTQNERRPHRGGRLDYEGGSGLTLEVHQVLEQLVRRRDDARVGLEAALCGDHLRERLREIDVGHLDHTGDGEAEVTAWRAGLDGARGRGLDPAIAGVALQARRVGEPGELDVAGGDARAERGARVVLVDEGDRAVLPDRDVARLGRDGDRLLAG